MSMTAYDPSLSSDKKGILGWLGFSRSAVMLVTRSPQMPIGPDGKAMDMAEDVIQVTDPVSGITFDVALYRQFMQLVFHVRLAWGYQAIKPNHIATLMG